MLHASKIATIALFATILAGAMYSPAEAQDTIRGNGKPPTTNELRTAEETIRRAKANPITVGVGGYVFIEVDPPQKITWYVVPNGTGTVRRKVLPKGIGYEGFLVKSGNTAWKWEEVPPSDKDRVMVVGEVPGQSTLLRITPGASPDDDANVLAYHFIIPGATPPVIVPPVVVPPVIVPPPVVVVPPVVEPIVEKLGFTTLAMTEAAKIDPTARALASKIADNFEAVQAKLAATGSMTIDQAMADLTTRNRDTLGTNRAAWLPWFTAWAAKADQHNSTGAMATSADYVTAFAETATGLRKVK